MQLVNDRKTKEATEKQEKEKELSKVKISKEDVDLIVSTFKVIFLRQILSNSIL